MSTLMACGVDAPAPAAPDTLLTSTEVEPSGAHCAAGGVAVHTGIDDNENGKLDQAEIDSTSYTCAHATLLREDTIGSGPVCPGGGIQVHSGHDLDDNGTLEDSEIEATTNACLSDEVFHGDLTTSAFASHGARERLSHVRVVTGNVLIDNNAPMPSLEMVGGSVELRTSAMIELPALGRITANLIGPPRALVNGQPPLSVQLIAPKLAAIGGYASLTSWTDTAGTFSTPSLATVDGGFVLGGKITTVQLDKLARVGGAVEFDVQPAALLLPALEQVGGRVRLGGWFKELDVHSLQTATSFELIYSSIPELRMPRLKTAPTIFLRRTPATIVEMPQVSGVAYLTVDGLHDLVTFDLPLVTELDTLSLSRMMTTDAALFSQLKVVKNLTVEKSLYVDLGGLDQLTEMDTLTIQNNANLVSLEGLDHVTTLTGDLMIKNNRSLANLKGLAGLKTVGGQIHIEDNVGLAPVEIEAFLRALSD